MNKFRTLFVAPALLLFFSACPTTPTSVRDDNGSQDANEATKPSPAATAVDDLALGKKHFLDNCARCHKEDGTGGPVEIEGKRLKPDNLTTEKMSKLPDKEYLEYMENGIPDEGMPSFKDVLSEEEMNQVVMYIRKELQKPKSLPAG